MNIRECLTYFINLEENAGRIYARIAEVCEGDLVEVAKDFEKQEFEHANKIKMLINSTKGHDIIVDPELFLLSKLGFPGKEINNMNTKLSTRKELFLFALQKEKDSILLYNEFSKHFKQDSEEYYLFQELSNEERQHMFYILKVLHQLK